MNNSGLRKKYFWEERSQYVKKFHQFGVLSFSSPRKWYSTRFLVFKCLHWTVDDQNILEFRSDSLQWLGEPIELIVLSYEISYVYAMITVEIKDVLLFWKQLQYWIDFLWHHLRPKHNVAAFSQGRDECLRLGSNQNVWLVLIHKDRIWLDDHCEGKLKI